MSTDLSSPKRVKYGKSPLVEVIFQLRFPTILKINAQQPVEFQDKIREKFPYYNEQLVQHGNLLINPQMQEPTLRKLGENKSYDFVSSDKLHKVTLAPSFISISTKKYSQWENFSSIIDFVIPAFCEIYKPMFFSRIGLRYIDVITRSNLGVENRNWKDLIQPHILGMIDIETEEKIKAFRSEIEYETKVENVLSRAHFELVHVNEKEELSFLLDCDYFILGMIQVSEMKSLANKLHSASSEFIQLAIKPELHNAMEPTEI